MAAKRNEVLIRDELAKYMKISKSTRYKKATDNKLLGQNFGKRWLFHRNAVDA